MKSKRYSNDSDMETEPRAELQTRKKNHRLEAAEPDALDVSSRAARRTARPAANFLAKPTPENQNVDLAPIHWTAPDPDEYGPLASELQKLFIDIVDPETGEVTRSPIMQVEDPPAVREDLSEQVAISPTSPAGQKPDEQAVIEISENQDTGEVDEQADDAATQAANVDDALQAIVAYLLSPVGAGLRRAAREAAYQARKAAYETASLEIQSQASSIQARILALEASFQKALDSVPGAERIAQCQNAWQSTWQQAESAEKAYQATREKLTEASNRADQARLLAGQGLIPQLVLAGLEADRQAAEQALAEAQAEHEQAQRSLQEATAARQAAQAGVQDQYLALEGHFRREKAQAEAELESLQARLKERMEELAQKAPEAVLWKAIQTERQCQEDEIAAKLIRELPAQGIKRTLQEATRLGIAENKKLLRAIAERQARVNTLIEACRAQAERLTAYPEVLPDEAYALLVRGDAIRVVDPGGRELAVHYAQGDGAEFHTMRSKNGRRWKLEPARDLWLVKQ